MTTVNLPHAPAWGDADGRRWAAATAPTWPRWVVVATAVAGVALGIVGDTSPCLASDPSYCGPDTGFALAVTLLGASVTLLWWRPVLAMLCGAAFAVLDLVFDDVAMARAGFSAYLLVCLGLAGFVVVSRRRQRAMVDRLVTSPMQLPASVPVATHRPRAHPLEFLDPGRMLPRAVGRAVELHVGRVLLVLVLIAGAVACGVTYQRAVSQEQAHVARAVEVTATAGGTVDEDGFVQRYTLVNPSAWMPASVDLEPLELADEGSATRILLDPEDPDWSRLVAEPADDTGWLSAAVALGLLALLLVLREVEVRAAVQRLRSGFHPGLAVEAVWLPGGEVLVLPAGERGTRRTVLATYACDAPALSAEQESAFEDGSPSELRSAFEPRPALLVGDLRERGWAAVVTDAGVIPPATPLRVHRHPDRFDAADFYVEEEGPSPWMEEVRPSVAESPPAVVPDLPAEPHKPGFVRPVGLLGLAAAPVAAPLATWWLWDGVFTLLPVVGVFTGLVGGAAEWAFGRVVFAPDGVRATGGFRSTTVPWSRVTRVTAGRGSVGVEWEEPFDGDDGSDPDEEPDVAGVEVELFQRVEPTSERYAAAETFAAGVRALVDRSGTGGEIVGRWTPALPVAVVTAVAVLVVVGVRLLG